MYEIEKRRLSKIFRVRIVFIMRTRTRIGGLRFAGKVSSLGVVLRVVYRRDSLRGVQFAGGILGIAVFRKGKRERGK
jgi:hypothetical protein